ncbi:MAG: hypothetical protein CBD21_03895 [bacterium TMED161]|nr:MAG: hypothetical protein CBD21_03895 [bacterium TMED161]
MTEIIIFFISHWYLSLFVQTIFLHRYASHQMFTMSSLMEKSFFLLTILAQGTSFLKPSLYAILHNKHHEFADTDKDPHTPVKHSNYFSFMLETLKNYNEGSILLKKKNITSFKLPSWDRVEKIADTYLIRFIFLTSYIVFYYYYAPNLWFFLLIPIHALMGPIHGFIVNWFGHKHGYRNFIDTGDCSTNTFPVDILMSGELYQNNHHKYPTKSNFAHKWFEVDFGYISMLFLEKLSLIKIKRTH